MGSNAYPRRILLAVTGLTPQIVTETLYALAVKSNPAFIPTEVHLITTREGAEHARLNLLSRDPGWFARCCHDYQLEGVRLVEDNIHVLRTENGAPLADIRTPHENELAADLITETVRELTSDPQSALHVSIAGGRKTMGFYVGYALSLYGRIQDRLSHVLVPAPYESHPEFYYPTPYERIIHTLDRVQRPLDCRHADVTMAAIPFVRMRHGLDERLLNGHATFSEVVASAQVGLAPPELVIDLAGSRARLGGRTLRLAPSWLALLAVFARRALSDKGPVAAPPKGVPDSEWAQWYLSEYRLIRGEMSDMEATERALQKGMDGEYFSAHLSKLRRTLRNALGTAASHYLIDDGGCRPRRYRLDLPADSVRFAGVDADDGISAS